MSDETLSIDAAAERLGVSRWTVWRMVADGDLDTQKVDWHGRLTTRVTLPIGQAGYSTASLPRSRTAVLQEQVDRLSFAVERLSEALLEAERRVEPAPALVAPAPPRARPPRPPVTDYVAPTPRAQRVVIVDVKPSREEMLAPVRALFEQRGQRPTWWRRLPHPARL